MLHDTDLNEFKANWYTTINSVTGSSGKGRNTSRTYYLFKTTFETEAYCKLILPLRHPAAFPKLPCGVAPLRIETDRYENKPLEESQCPFCDVIESEILALLYCSLYRDKMAELFRKKRQVVPVLVLLLVALWFILRGDLFYDLPCVILFLCFLVLLALRLLRLVKRELFLRLFNLRLFGFVCFLFLLSGKGCGL